MGWSEEQRCRTDPSDLVGVPSHNIGMVVRISQREIPMVIFVRVLMQWFSVVQNYLGNRAV